MPPTYACTVLEVDTLISLFVMVIFSMIAAALETYPATIPTLDDVDMVIGSSTVPMVVLSITKFLMVPDETYPNIPV